MNRSDPLERRVEQLTNLNQRLQDRVRQLEADNKLLRDHKGVPASQPKARGVLDKKGQVDVGKAAAGNVSAGVIIMAIYAIFREGGWPVGSERFWTDEGIYAVLFGVLNTLIAAGYKAGRKFD